MNKKLTIKICSFHTQVGRQKFEVAHRSLPSACMRQILSVDLSIRFQQSLFKPRVKYQIKVGYNLKGNSWPLFLCFRKIHVASRTQTLQPRPCSPRLLISVGIVVHSWVSLHLLWYQPGCSALFRLVLPRSVFLYTFLEIFHGYTTISAVNGFSGLRVEQLEK